VSPSIVKHLQKLRARGHVSAEEEQVISDLISRSIEVPAHRTFIHAGRELNDSTLLLDGWMARAKDLQSGQRQLAELQLSGDFVDLHGFTLKRLDHDIVTVTQCLVALVPHERLRTMTERYPHLTRLYWLMTNIDAAIQREWTLSLGRRTAIQRVAQLFCELRLRLEVTGDVEGNSYDFPLTQTELGEFVGLTPVHVNRTLQELRRRGLLELKERRAKVLDVDAIESVAEFDPCYLYLEQRAF